MRRVILSGLILGLLSVFFKLSTGKLPETSYQSGIQSGFKIPEKNKEDVFKFMKSISVKFDFNDEVIKHEFYGLFFLDWSGTKIATASLKMDGHEPDIFIRAHFSQDFIVRCVEIPKNLNEKESDYILLLKDLILDYSFKTSHDANGQYLASLSTKLLPGGFEQITKIKSSYLNPDLKVENSLHEIKIGPSLLEAKGEERFLINTASMILKYELLATSAKAKPMLNKSRELADCSNDFFQEIKVLTTYSTEELKTLLSGVEKIDRGARHDSMRKILKALRSNPELLVNYMDWVHSISDDKKLAALAVGILGNLGTPEAQIELMGLYNQMQPLVLNTFTLMDARLTEKSRDFLRAQINGPYAEGAAYALGSSQDLSFLLGALEEATTPTRINMFLDALGNSGSSEIMGTLKKYLSSDDISIREKALYLLKKDRFH